MLIFEPKLGKLRRSKKLFLMFYQQFYSDNYHKLTPTIINVSYFYRDLDPGDISEQIALRKKLECKPFKWFMQEVAFDLYKHYPPIDPPDFVYGEIRYGQCFGSVVI